MVGSVCPMSAAPRCCQPGCQSLRVSAVAETNSWFCVQNRLRATAFTLLRLEVPTIEGFEHSAGMATVAAWSALQETRLLGLISPDKVNVELAKLTEEERRSLLCDSPMNIAVELRPLLACHRPRSVKGADQHPVKDGLCLKCESVWVRPIEGVSSAFTRLHKVFESALKDKIMDDASAVHWNKVVGSCSALRLPLPAADLGDANAKSVKLLRIDGAQDLFTILCGAAIRRWSLPVDLDTTAKSQRRDKNEKDAAQVPSSLFCVLFAPKL